MRKAASDSEQQQPGWQGPKRGKGHGITRRECLGGDDIGAAQTAGASAVRRMSLVRDMACLTFAGLENERVRVFRPDSADVGCASGGIAASLCQWVQTVATRIRAGSIPNAP